MSCIRSCWNADKDGLNFGAVERLGERSAKQAIALTEYFIENFNVDANRICAADYSAGGETMSRAVSMRPDLQHADRGHWSESDCGTACAPAGRFLSRCDHERYYCFAPNCMDARGLYALRWAVQTSFCVKKCREKARRD